MSTITDRVKEYLDHRGLSMRQFDIAVNRAPGYLSNILKQGSVFSADLLSVIIEIYPDLNVEWLITGRGDMLSEIDKVNDGPSDYLPADSIDRAIDKKIDRKIEDLSISLKELIAYEINNRIEVSIKKYHEKKIEEGY